MIAALLAQIWPYLLGLAALVAGYVTARQSGKSAGRAEVERKQERAASESRRKTNEADTKLATMDDDDIRSDLAKWVRHNGD